MYHRHVTVLTIPCSRAIYRSVSLFKLSKLVQKRGAVKLPTYQRNSEWISTLTQGQVSSRARQLFTLICIVGSLVVS